MKTPSIKLGPSTKEQLAQLEQIRQLAFQPIFDSFREILGPRLYAIAQEKEDMAQADILSSMFDPESRWNIFTLFQDETIVGFVTVLSDKETRLGEIGLNAIHPEYAGRGLGTQMFELAIEKLREAGMLAAHVATGGDPSHTPARRAYEKAGFDRQIPSVWFCREI